MISTYAGEQWDPLDKGEATEQINESCGFESRHFSNMFPICAEANYSRQSADICAGFLIKGNP